MSGIAVIYHTDGRAVDERRLQRMLDSLTHRGPDGAGIWSSGSVGLAHSMLRTTPEAWHEQQPLSNADKSLWLTADARVDNREDLRAALLASRAPLRDDTDAELILGSYEVWGENCPAKIIGDFAFVIWDARSRRLFCARDPFGIRPLYYHFDGKTFRCASTPEALLSDGTIPRELNLGAICLALLNRSGDRDEALYKNIFRLPPAHTVVVENGQLTKTRYWNIDPARTVRHRTDADYEEHFHDLWRTSVAARLRSQGRVGALLSGGLDSSSVVCTAAAINRETRCLGNTLEAFSIVFDQLPCDERLYIEAVIRKWNMRASSFSQEGHASWLDFERTERYPDCFYTPTLFMIGPALEQARQEQMRTMLTGIGGDDLIASSAVHLTDLMRQRRFAALFRQLPHDAKLLSCSRWSLLRDHCLKPLVPESARAIMRSLISPTRATSIPVWMRRDCLHRPDVTEHATNGTAEVRFPTLAQERIHRALVRGWNTNVALGRLDSFASHFGIECRHPFFDRRLVEFLCAVPDEQRWSGPWRKAILRRAMAGILPEAVRCRQSKADFSPLVDRELNERQSDHMDRLIGTSLLGEWGVLHVAEFQRLVERYRRGTNSSGERLACQNVVGLELWCRLATGSVVRPIEP
jgi:asparagine synthase (glutamine-hydrolysing)